MNKITMQRCLVFGIWIILLVYGTVLFADEPNRKGLVDKGSIDPETSCAIGRWQRCDIQEAVKRGLFETGLSPRFPEQVKCPEIDETYAKSYTHKRPREMYHGGIDIPAPDGTPIIAAMGGEVVAVYDGKGSPRGIEVVIRHTPEDSGLPLWIYTQYTHFSEMLPLTVGKRIHMGDVLGPTGNTGISPFTGIQSKKRRPALHFGAFYSTKSEYADFGDRIIPVNGHWMDPLSLYRGKLPIDSTSLKALPEEEKKVSVSVMLENGIIIHSGAKALWPYVCIQQK
jgi:hypothetical protein